MDIIDSANEINELYIQASLLNHITTCVSGVTKNRSHLIAHTAVKIAVMIMNGIKGRMDRRMKMEGMTMPRKEAAAYIGISEDTLSRWCKLGLIAYTRKDPSKKNSPYLFTRAACIAAANKSIHNIPVNAGETREGKSCLYSEEVKYGTETTRRQAVKESRNLLAQRTRSSRRSCTTQERSNYGA